MCIRDSPGPVLRTDDGSGARLAGGEIDRAQTSLGRCEAHLDLVFVDGSVVVDVPAADVIAAGEPRVVIDKIAKSEIVHVGIAVDLSLIHI